MVVIQAASFLGGAYFSIDTTNSSGRIMNILIKLSPLTWKSGNIELISIKGEQGTAYVKPYLYSYINNIAAMSKAANGNEAVFKEIYDNYRNSSFNLSVSSVKDKLKSKDMTAQSIGYLIMIVLMSAGNLSEIILKEKQNRTYFRISTAPISSKKYIIANVILNFVILFTETVITLLALTKVFKIDTGIPLSLAY